MRRSSIGLLVAAGFGLAASASGAARTCRILFLAPPPNAPETVCLADGKSMREVRLPSMNFSEVYELAGGDVTLRLIPHPPSGDEPIPAAAPKVKVSETITDLYLFVASDPTNPVLPLRMQVINAGGERFREGQLMWFNLSPFQVGGQVGSHTLNLQPNSRTVLDAPAEGNKDYPVKLRYLPAGATRSEPICSTVWRHNPGARSVLFVLKYPDSRLPRVLEFPDRREQPPEEE